MTASTFDQFRRFSTDAYGLERLLRFIQSAVQILAALVANSPAVFDIVSNALKTHEVRRPLAELSSRLGLIRRFIRFFRFMDAFSDSYGTFTSLTEPADKKGANAASSTRYLEKTLDGLASTFNGMYLLLEAATIVDALGIQGLTMLGAELAFTTKIEAQRCWFLALVFGALSCVLKLSKAQKVAKPVSEKTVDAGKDEKRRDMETKSQPSKMTSQQVRLLRKLMTCLLDLPLPGTIVGWIPASPGTLGLLMLTTSVLSGFDVWQRCGREVDVGKV
ncbi:hypothetical protein MBLNU13_g06847t1 [Cladosporium sp. NU13]